MRASPAGLVAILTAAVPIAGSPAAGQDAAAPWAAAARGAIAAPSSPADEAEGAASPADAAREAGPGQLTLADAVTRALARFPSAEAGRARADAARRELGEARAAWLPSVSLGASATRYEEPMVVTPIHGFDPANLPAFDDVLLQGALTADWLLFDGGGREARIGVRRSLARAADADATAGDQAVLGRTIAAYLRVLGGAATLEAHDRRLAAIEAEEGRVRQLVDVGRAPEVDLRRAEATLAAAQAERVRLASALDVSERDLARLVAEEADVTRAGRLVPVALRSDALPPRDELRARALAASPAVRAAKERAAAARSAVSANRSARWPSLHAVGNLLSYGSDDESFVHEWNAGVKLSLPLFTGGAISSRIGQSQAARSAADAERRLAVTRVEEELDGALASAEQAHARTTSLGTAVAKFEEVARIEKLRLETEAGTQTDWLDAEAELLVAEARLVEARNAEIAARAEIARITGDLDPDWIARNLEARP